MNSANCYLRERTLWYDRDEGPQKYVFSASSILGALLWNVMYNDVLNLSISEEDTVVDFADNIALVEVAKYREDAKLYSCKTIIAVNAWLKSDGLAVSEEKTEAALITKHRNGRLCPN